jgi:hypothetical protein
MWFSNKTIFSKFWQFLFFKKQGLLGRRILQHFAKFHPKKKKNTALVLVPQKWLAMGIVEYNTSYAIFCLLF